MKNILQNKLSNLLLMLIILSLNSCLQNFNDLADTFENDLNLEISTDLLYNLAALQFIDSRTQNIPANISVELGASDFSDVYTFAGKKDLSPTDGMLLLGIRKAELPSSENNKSLYLKISAPGYYPIQQFITSDTSYQNLIISMTAIAAPGQSIRTQTTIPQNNQVFSINMPNGVQIRFDENTRFLDQQKVVVNGGISADVQYYPGNNETKRFFEDILIDSSFINPQGQKSPIAINPAGMLDVKLSSNNQMVSDLTYPAEIILPLDQNLFNPIKDRTIQEGDYIPAFYWDENLMAWQADGFSIVEKINGQLVAAMSVRHFTLWITGWANVSMMGEGTEECQVFIRVLADTPLPIQGSYMNGNTTINYQYNQLPEYRYFQIYSNCQSGQGFSPGSLAGLAKLEAQAFFKAVDPTVFSSMRFTDQTAVEVVFPPVSCSMQDQNNFQLNLEAAHAGMGTLSFQFGNFFGSRQVNLQAGTNVITLPILPGSLNRWLYDTGTFRFEYLDDNCTSQSSVRRVALCDIPNGVNLGINNPVPQVPIMVDLALSAVCLEQDNSVIIRPSLPIFYKQSCSPEKIYRRLEYIQDGIFNGTLPLVIGEDYDFRIQFGNNSTVFENITIPANSASYNLGDQLLTLEIIDGVLVFKVDDYQLPQGICSFIG